MHAFLVVNCVILLLVIISFLVSFSHNTSSRSQLKGRDQAQLKQVEMSDDEISEMVWTQLQRVCRDIPVQDNFYLSWWLRGQREYNPLTMPNFCPPYVTKEGFTRLKVSWTLLIITIFNDFCSTAKVTLIL